MSHTQIIDDDAQDAWETQSETQVETQVETQPETQASDSEDEMHGYATCVCLNNPDGCEHKLTAACVGLVENPPFVVTVEDSDSDSDSDDEIPHSPPRRTHEYLLPPGAPKKAKRHCVPAPGTGANRKLDMTVGSTSLMGRMAQLEQELGKVTHLEQALAKSLKANAALDNMMITLAGRVDDLQTLIRMNIRLHRTRLDAHDKVSDTHGVRLNDIETSVGIKRKRQYYEVPHQEHKQ